MSNHCPRCDAGLVASVEPSASARAGPIAASVDARPSLRCVAGCRTPDDGARTAIATAITRGLTFAAGRPETARCGSCDCTLDLPMRATVRAVTVEHPERAPFTLTFALPLVRCGRCGIDNVAAGLERTVRRCAEEACGLLGTGWFSSVRLLRWLRGRDGRGRLAQP